MKRSPITTAALVFLSATLAGSAALAQAPKPTPAAVVIHIDPLLELSDPDVPVGTCQVEADCPKAVAFGEEILCNVLVLQKVRDDQGNIDFQERKIPAQVWRKNKKRAFAWEVDVSRLLPGGRCLLSRNEEPFTLNNRFRFRPDSCPASLYVGARPVRFFPPQADDTVPYACEVPDGETEPVCNLLRNLDPRKNPNQLPEELGCTGELLIKSCKVDIECPPPTPTPSVGPRGPTPTPGGPTPTPGGPTPTPGGPTPTPGGPTPTPGGPTPTPGGPTPTPNGPQVQLFAAPVCMNDAPYIDYVVQLTGVPPTLTTLRLLKTDGQLIEILANRPLQGRILWPGAQVNAQGQMIAWPGWQFVNGMWVMVNDGLRPRLDIQVNPRSVTVDYPPTIPNCNPNPCPGRPGCQIDPTPTPTPTATPIPTPPPTPPLPTPTMPIVQDPARIIQRDNGMHAVEMHGRIQVDVNTFDPNVSGVTWKLIIGGQELVVFGVSPGGFEDRVGDVWSHQTTGARTNGGLEFFNFSNASDGGILWKAVKMKGYSPSLSAVVGLAPNVTTVPAQIMMIIPGWGTFATTGVMKRQGPGGIWSMTFPLGSGIAED